MDQNYDEILNAVNELRKEGASDEDILKMLKNFAYPEEMIVAALNGNQNFTAPN